MRHLQIPPTVYEERKERYEKRISAMLDYVSSDTVCRSRMLLHYFGEKNEHNCGQCDTCINLKNKKPSGHLSEKEFSERFFKPYLINNKLQPLWQNRYRTIKHAHRCVT